MAQITLEEFAKVEIRVGKVVDAQDFPEARNPSYKLWIDFGEFGVKKSSAAIRRWYAKEDPELLDENVRFKRTLMRHAERGAREYIA